MGSSSWGLAEVWNKSLEKMEVRDPEPRSHLWASELGKAPIDLYLKLKGVKPSNPPNARSMRKFEAGNVFEWIVSLILKRAGVLKEQQHWCSHQYPGLMKVTGKADFIAGGTPDYVKWKKELEILELPNVFVRATESVMEYLKTKNGLKEMPLEIKSTSGFMFDSMERSGKPSKNHRMQLFHYLKSDNWTEGTLIYVSRDDLRILEFPILNPGKVEEEYRGEIERVTNALKNDEQPPKEEMILFDEDLGKFTKNWNVAYSGYLTHLYGLKDQKQYDDIYSSIVEKWNRVLNRIKEDKKLTDKNLESLKEIGEQGFNIEDITKNIKQ